MASSEDRDIGEDGPGNIFRDIFAFAFICMDMNNKITDLGYLRKYIFRYPLQIPQAILSGTNVLKALHGHFLESRLIFRSPSKRGIPILLIFSKLTTEETKSL